MQASWFTGALGGERVLRESNKVTHVANVAMQCSQLIAAACDLTADSHETSAEWYVRARARVCVFLCGCLRGVSEFEQGK